MLPSGTAGRTYTSCIPLAHFCPLCQCSGTVHICTNVVVDAPFVAHLEWDGHGVGVLIMENLFCASAWINPVFSSFLERQAKVSLLPTCQQSQ